MVENTWYQRMLKSVNGRSMATPYAFGPILLQMMTVSRLTRTPDPPTSPNRNSSFQLWLCRTNR